MDDVRRNADVSSLGHQAGTKWAFDDTVTQCFDDMLKRSIPQYDVMRKACHDLAVRYARRSTAIVDLGCSRGEAIAELVKSLGSDHDFVGVEVSPPMIAAATRRFEAAPHVHIRAMDLRTDYPRVSASVTLAVLTLQFTPIEYRHHIVRRVFTHTRRGGVFIMVEKVLGDTADLDASMVQLYYGLKAANGYKAEEIDRKRLSLEGVLVPVTAAWNVELLRASGFRQVECFWRWMNFAGWFAVKE